MDVYDLIIISPFLSNVSVSPSIDQFPFVSIANTNHNGHLPARYQSSKRNLEVIAKSGSQGLRSDGYEKDDEVLRNKLFLI